MYWTVKSVVPMENYWLHLTFENSEQRYFDMKPMLETGVFRALKDPKVFRTVRVAFDSIAWDNEIDIAPETLYHDGLYYAQVLESYPSDAAFEEDDDEACGLADAKAAANDENIIVDDYLKAINERAKCTSK